jgi:hypothetical protein
MTGAEWQSRRDTRVRLGVEEVLAMFGGWDFSAAERVSLQSILGRLYAAGCNAGPNPSHQEQGEKGARRRAQLRTRQSSPEEVSQMRSDLMAPFGAAKARRA